MFSTANQQTVSDRLLGEVANSAAFQDSVLWVYGALGLFALICVVAAYLIQLGPLGVGTMNGRNAQTFLRRNTMKTKQLSILFLSLLSMLAVACGGAGDAELGGAGGAGGGGGFGGEGGFGGDPVDPPPVAPFDNDSADNPAVDDFLSITGQREIVYTDEISAEAGDNEDFVQFELPNNSNPDQRITVAIDCAVFGDEEVFARVELLNVDGNDTKAAPGSPIDCNEGEVNVTVRNDQVQLARIFVQGVPEEQTLVEYTIMVTPFR
jgi:hypothetical protein